MNWAIIIIIVLLILFLIIAVVFLTLFSDPWTGNWVDDYNGKKPITKLTKIDNKVRIQFQSEDYTVHIQEGGKIFCWGLTGTNKGNTIVWTDSAGKIVNTFYKV
jgi:hypothetical protein